MRKLALLLALLALGALGLTACGGGDDNEATPASETATIGAALEAGPTRKDCGEFRPFPGDDYPAIKVAVVGGDNSCFAARAVMRDFYTHGNRWTEETPGVRTRGSWTCHGPEGLVKCKKSGAPSGETIRGHFDQGTLPPDPAEATAASETETTVGSGEAVTEADPGTSNRRNEERIEQKANKWAAAFAAGRGACRYMGQPACGRQVCKRLSSGPIKNCTPVSVEFRRSFDGATVERVVVSEDRRHARAEFSNGESVGFEGQRVDGGDKGEGWGNWAFFITEEWIKNAGRS